MKVVAIFIIFLILNQVDVVYSQEARLTVEVSSDSILIGNYFELKFTIENADGNFEAPELYEFDLLGGPNVSSSFQFVNGKSSQKTAYTYYFKPRVIGVFTILPAYLNMEEVVLETPPLEIQVVAEPGDGSLQRDSRFAFTQKGQKQVPTKKSKRKLQRF